MQFLPETRTKSRRSRGPPTRSQGLCRIPKLVVHLWIKMYMLFPYIVFLYLKSFGCSQRSSWRRSDKRAAQPFPSIHYIQPRFPIASKFWRKRTNEEEPFAKRYKSENIKSGSSSTSSGVVFSKSADLHLIKALPLWKVEQQESKLQKGKENFISQKIKHFSFIGYLSNAWKLNSGSRKWIMWSICGLGC